MYATLVTNCIQYQSTDPYLCSACASGYTLVAFDDGTNGCILTTDVIAGCLNYSVANAGFCSDGYCDTANGYTQVAQVGADPGITCIPTTQVKTDCA